MKLYEQAARRSQRRRRRPKLAEAAADEYVRSWDPDSQTVTILVRGITSSSKKHVTYDYTIELPIEELGYLLDAALGGFTKGQLRTLAEGVTRSFREAGRPKKKRQKSGA